MRTGIDKARWVTLSPLLDELLVLDAAARAERVAQIRRDDPRLADDLSALLSQQAAIEREGFLEGAVPRPAAEPTLAGQVIGSYTLDRLLGQGGMGTVWLAHRSDGRYEARVAVKLLNLALLGPGGIERFRREGSALGRLTHPNIARLIDAGVTQAGQPYLVLDYIDGETINHWCESRALDVRSRVRLFLEVLAALAHAHSKLILHRDLKPSNILVTPEGQVKLVDFGIAKLLDDESGAAPMAGLTQLAGQAFTPEYAAPEQLQGGEVTMRPTCMRSAYCSTFCLPDSIRLAAANTPRSIDCVPSSIPIHAARATPGTQLAPRWIAPAQCRRYARALCEATWTTSSSRP